MGMLLLVLQLLSRVLLHSWSEMCQPPWQFWECVPQKCLEEVQLQVLEHRRRCRRVRETPASAAEGRLEQLCGEHWIRGTSLHLPIDPPAQSPSQDQKDFGG